ncbi:hypothetical protein ACPDHL_12095 [Myroides sp. C15-4]|uniref:hypothetical protein n=1 Tax=Myroides sp. C15-4 TaxID=3400532 RepID=UPI003D2F6EBD
MNKVIKTIALASFFLTIVGCSSDDTSKTPEGPTFENKQLISHVKSTYYWNDEEYKEDGTTQHISGTDYVIDFNFSYDDHLALSALTYKVIYYQDNEIRKVTDGVFNFKLNQAGQLETLDITGDIMFRNTYTYTYTDGLVSKIESNDGSQKSEQTFTYNAAKQMIQSEIPSIPWTFNYTYNNQNQLIKIQNNRTELPEQIEYDAKSNPFKDLPFDLTSVLFEGVNYIPLTYMFPNNIQGYKTPYLDTYQLEYKYDENNNPIKASIYYQSDNQPKELDYEIDYSYITKKVEVTK